MSQCDFSLVICTYNRLEVLKSCLESVIASGKELRFPLSFEIVVVDNNSSDGTFTFAQTIAQNSEVPFQVLKEPQQGLSFARNAGWKSARGLYIGFTDDDARLPKNYFSELAKILEERKNLLFFGGPIELSFDAPPPAWFPKEYGRLANQATGAKILDIPNVTLSGPNFIVKKTVLEDLKGFRTELGMRGDKLGYGEEVDLQIRAKMKAIPIWFFPEISVVHIMSARKISLRWLLHSTLVRGYDARGYLASSPSPLRVLGRFLISLLKAAFIFFLHSGPLKGRIYYALKVPLWEMGIMISFCSQILGLRKYSSEDRNSFH